jgi:hypothetical protein
VSTTPLTSDDTAGIAFPIAVANQGSGSSAAPWFYWAENENNIIHGLPLASSGGSTVPTNLTSESSNQGAIYSVVTAMTADGTNVYWTQGSSVFSVPVSPAIDDADGGAPVATLAVSSTNQTSTGLSAIASDGVNVYWAWTSSGDGGQSTGSIVKCAIGGCETPTTLAAKQDAPFGIAVDATSVYWTTGNGTVMKVTPK